MKKNILLLVLAIACALTCAFAFAACNDGTHTTHNWSATYTQDGDRHYQTCDGCNEKKYAEHDFTNGNCVCGKEKPSSGHTHQWATADWQKNDTHHWHECTASGCDVTDNSQKNGYGEHDFTNGNCVCGKVRPLSSAEVTAAQWQSIIVDMGVIGVDSNVTLTTYLPDGSEYYVYEIAVGRNKFLVAGNNENSAVYIEWDKNSYNSETKTYACNLFTYDTNAWVCEVAELTLDIDWDLQLFVLQYMQYDNFEYNNQDGTYHSKQTVTISLKDDLGVEVSDMSVKFDNGKITEIEGNFVQVINGERRSLGVLEYKFTKYGETTVTLPSNVHTHAWVADGDKTDVAATCTTVGIHYVKCSCGAENTEEIPVNTNAHSWNDGEITTPATCTANGVKTYTCNHNSQHTKTEDIDIDTAAHNWNDGEITTPATCTANGVKTFTCNHNNQHTKTEDIPKTAHTYGDNLVCTECGAHKPSDGLRYKLSNDGTYYTVSKGTCADTEIYIPSTYYGKPVTSIGECAFYCCSSLTSITIPDSVTSIGIQAFQGCSHLTSITIPDSVTSIGDYAFSDCRVLTSITISDSVTSIGDCEFFLCVSLTSITIPNSVRSIGRQAFGSCRSLTSITIPDGVTSIGDKTFSSCSNLTTVTIPDSVTSIGDDAFKDCPIETATIPAIACRYIRNSELKTVVITSGNTIGADVFWNCSSLTSVTIPDSVTRISTYAFNGCSSLTSITFNGTKEQWYEIGLSIDVDNCTVHCTDGDIAKEN